MCFGDVEHLIDQLTFGLGIYINDVWGSFYWHI